MTAGPSARPHAGAPAQPLAFAAPCSGPLPRAAGSTLLAVAGSADDRPILGHDHSAPRERDRPSRLGGFPRGRVDETRMCCGGGSEERRYGADAAGQAGNLQRRQDQPQETGEIFHLR